MTTVFSDWACIMSDADHGLWIQAGLVHGLYQVEIAGAKKTIGPEPIMDKVLLASAARRKYYTGQPLS